MEIWKELKIEDYYISSYGILKKEHKEKVKNHYKLKYKNRKLENNCSNSVSNLILG